MGEWPSELSYYTENWEDTGLNPTRRSDRPWDSTSLRGFRLPLGRIKNQTHRLTSGIGLMRLLLRQLPKFARGAAK